METSKIEVVTLQMRLCCFLTNFYEQFRKNLCICICLSHRFSLITRKSEDTHEQNRLRKRTWALRTYVILVINFYCSYKLLFRKLIKFSHNFQLASYNFQNSLETILSSTECNLTEFINEIPQIFTTNKINPECREKETNGENTHIFCNNFSTSSVSTSKGCSIFSTKKYFGLNLFISDIKHNWKQQINLAIEHTKYFDIHNRSRANI